MTTKKYELTGLGNALVDVLAHGSDEFLSEYGIVKGAMNLIDEERAKALYAAMAPGREVSGGSAGNTMAGFASLGGRGAFMGKVADDQLGRIFAHDLRAGGTEFFCNPLKGGPETGRCLIVITPDAQRSMNTYLGAGVEFSEADVDENVIADSKIIYLEGYLFDRDTAKSAYRKASRVAHERGADVALTLSDSFCVERHRADFQRLIENDVDILFANEAEILALYQSTSLDHALESVRPHCRVIAVTRSEKGCVILNGGETLEIPAFPVDRVIDTTGAGDQFAAGFLFGLARGRDLYHCGQLGCLAASEVIAHVGPRPETPLAELAARMLPQAA
ncbi:MAG: adenosine kinase [Rhodospirillales bacterium]|nr:adenosine kinase [Alphaproteobacteria bacterium]MCB9987296.1 adenosine kinase [Rhodospirillales bacterium]USO07847.1 MAG: adenosine kinase [Rhodospirillales bacterium]